MKKYKVYLDNCCFNRPYDDQSQLKINMEAIAKLHIQQNIREGKIELVTSYILIAENNANRFESKRNDIKTFIDEYTEIYVSRERNEDVKRIANEIMSTGIKLMEACHVACAVIAGCDYFLTTDKRLLKYQSQDIKIINPVNYLLGEEDV